MARKTFDSTEYNKAIRNFDKVHCLACGAVLPDWSKLKPRPHSLSVLAKCCNTDCKEAFLKRTLFNWQELRLKAIKRDHYTCQDCGYIAPIEYAFPGYNGNMHRWGTPRQTELLLQVHHKHPIKDGGAEFDIDNCITLCKECHKKRHAATPKAIKIVNKTLEGFFNENQVQSPVPQNATYV